MANHVPDKVVPFFDGTKQHSITAGVPAEKIKSGYSEIPLSPGSYGHSDNTWTIRNGYAIYKTANRIHAFNLADEEYASDGTMKHGLPDHWEYSGPRFRDFKLNGEANYPNRPSNDLIPTYYDMTGNKVGGILYIEGITATGLWTPDINDTQVRLYTTKELVNINDMNAVGKRVSQAYNFKQKVHGDLLFNENNQLHYEIAKWVEFLDSKGIPPTKNPVLGIGVGKGGYVAFHAHDLNYLVAHTDFREIAKKYAERYGLSDSDAVSAMERGFMMHELAHAFGIGGSDLGEQLQGRLQAKFYSELAKEFKGTKFERIYKALAHEGEDYAQRFSLISRLVHESQDAGPFWNLMEHKFFHEAEALGLEGRAMEQYIKAREKNALGPMYVEDDANESESQAKNNPKSSNLEKIVESAAHDAVERSSGQNYKNQIGTAKILKFVKGRNKEKASGKQDTYARSSARETYESSAQSNYREGSRGYESEARTDSDAKSSDKAEASKGESSESKGEGQASEKAA